MAKLAAIKYNDATNGENINVSVWVQGCPHHCKGCHNPETWSFSGGIEIPPDFKEQIEQGLNKNGVQRNLSILGGEPLCTENKDLINDLLSYIRPRFPHIKIFLWTGYQFYQVYTDPVVHSILDKIDILIDGPFVEELKDLTLKLRGSSNQHIWEKINNVWYLKE